MRKKLTKHGNSLALVLDKPILKLLKIEEETDIELTVQGNALVIKAATKKSLTKAQHQKEIRDIAKKVTKQYEQTFKKLAKT